MARVAQTTAHDPRASELPADVQQEYIETAKRLYTQGKLTLEELETVLDVVLTGETGPREFRDWAEEQFGVDGTTWLPVLEGCVMYV